LFFTRGVSLRDWHSAGMLDREIAYYKHLNNLGVSTTFITWGNKLDLKLTEKIYPIKVCCNKWGLPRRLYELCIPILFIKILKSAVIIKSNQLFGGKFALRAGHIYKKPVIIRNGWFVSKTLELHGASEEFIKKIKKLEKKLFSNSNSIIVTTSLIKKELIYRYKTDKSKINVIPNYIDTRLFKPMPVAKEFDAIYIGRLEEEKNPEIFLNAISVLKLKVLIIGKGSLKDDLQKRYKYLGDNIEWIDSIPNNDLPEYYNKSKLYIIPSKYENNPKTLLESMACGIPVIGADVMGIRDIIKDGNNGFLYNGTSESLIKKITELINSPGIQVKIANNALNFIKRHYDFKKIAREEYNLFQKLTCI